MKTLLLIGMLVSGVFAQNTGQNVINAPLVPATAITSNTTYTSNPIQNIGQTNHTLVTTISAVVSGNLTMSVQGSVDGVTYSNIGNVTRIVGLGIYTPPTVYYSYGYGAYPYIRVKVIFDSGASLTYAVTYIGSSIPVNPVVDMTGQYANMIDFTGRLSVGSSVGTVLVAAPNATTRIVVYGLDLFFDGTQPSGDELEISCNSPVNRLVFSNLGTQKTFIYPTGIRPMLTCLPGNNLIYKLGTVGTADPYITYHVRFE